jgi:hypothetical protein
MPVFAGTAHDASIKPMKMMNRSMAMADSEAIGGGDGGADPGLGVTDRGCHVLALGKPGRDRG